MNLVSLFCKFCLFALQSVHFLFMNQREKAKGVVMYVYCKIYILDDLWCQPIKLSQVVSLSEFREYSCNNIAFIIFPLFDFLKGFRSLKRWLLQKSSMKNMNQNSKFLIKKQVFWCPIISRRWIFWPLKIQF